MDDLINFNILIFEAIGLMIFLALSAFFSGAETALFSLSKLHLKKLQKKEHTVQVESIVKLLDDPQRTLITILIGNMFVNITASSLATYLAIKLFGNIGVGIASGFMVFMILVFGEVVPKSLAITHAEKISKRVARTIELLSMILFPLIKLLKLLINGLYNLFGMNKKRKKKEITEEDLITLINVGKDEGVIEEQEKKMIKNIFEFGDTTVKEVMIPRVDIDFAPHDVTLNSIVKMIKKSGHSRIPVYEGTIDNIIGILYVKDILKIYRKLFQLKETFDVKKILRKAYFVPENKKIDELLDIFQKDRIQIAIVIDEYSGTDGLVTMEDVLEEIVGEIIDEYDKEIELFKKIDENTFIADGMINIDKINEILHVKIPEDDFETLGGFIYKLIEKVPREEEEIIYKNIKIIIKRVIKNRIKRVKIIKLSPEIQKD